MSTPPLVWWLCLLTQVLAQSNTHTHEWPLPAGRAATLWINHTGTGLVGLFSHTVQEDRSHAVDAIRLPSDKLPISSNARERTLDQYDAFQHPLSFSFESIALGVCPALVDSDTLLTLTANVFGDANATATVDMHTYQAQLTVGRAEYARVRCASMQYHYFEITEETYAFEVEVLQTGDTCADPTDDNAPCPFGAVFLSYGGCPTSTQYDFRQTFSRRAILTWGQQEPLLKGTYVVAVAGDSFSATFDKGGPRDRYQRPPFKSVTQCDQDVGLAYKITVTTTGDNHDMLVHFFAQLGMFLPGLCFLLAVRLYKGKQSDKDSSHSADTTQPQEMEMRRRDEHAVDDVMPSEEQHGANNVDKTSPDCTDVDWEQGAEYEHWFILMVVGFFAGAAALQSVWVQAMQDMRNQEVCHYNFACRRDLHIKGWLQINAFNNVLSNLSYMMCGLFIIAYVEISKRYFKGHRNAQLIIALGVAMIFEGVFSSLYHVCPSIQYFQFDTIFMFFTCGVCFCALYARRHKNNIRVKSFFGFFVSVVLFNAYGVFSYLSGAPLAFWIPFFILLAGFSVFAALWFYHFDAKTPRELLDKVRQRLFQSKPHHTARFVIILIMFVVTWVMAVLLFSQEVVSSDVFLFLSVVMWMLYSIYYFVMKFLVHHEPFQSYVGIIFALFLVSAGTGGYAFTQAITDKTLPLDWSRAINQDCWLGIYDSHDVWHFLSAYALTFLALLLFHVDDGRIKTKHTAQF